MRIYLLTLLILCTISLTAQKTSVNWGGSSKGKNFFNYKVESGDNLSHIAHKFGTTVKALQKANPQLGKALNIGTIIHIPYKKTTPSTKPNAKKTETATEVDTAQVNKMPKPIIYTVKKGDTYASIMRTYNIKDPVIFDKQNNLQNHSVKMGQKLIVGFDHSNADIDVQKSTQIKGKDTSRTVVIGGPTNHIFSNPPSHIYRSDTATLNAFILEDCGSDAKYIFTSDYPLGTRLTLVNTTTNKSVSVTVTSEKPELSAYANVSLLMSCATAHSLEYNHSLKTIRVLVSK